MESQILIVAVAGWEGGGKGGNDGEEPGGEKEARRREG